MGDASLVIHHDSLAAIGDALTQAHKRIEDEVESVLSDVDRQISGWSESTASRAAQMRYEQRLKQAVQELTDALDRVQGAVMDVASGATDTEIKNVATLS